MRVRKEKAKLQWRVNGQENRAKMETKTERKQGGRKRKEVTRDKLMKILSYFGWSQ